MTIRVDKRSQWHDPNFEPNAGLARDYDEFAPLDVRGLGLRPFLEKETQARAVSSSGSGSETLVRGRVFLRTTPSGEYELTLYRGRGCFDAYLCQSREEALALAEELQKGR